MALHPSTMGFRRYNATICTIIIREWRVFSQICIQIWVVEQFAFWISRKFIDSCFKTTALTLSAVHMRLPEVKTIYSMSANRLVIWIYLTLARFSLSMIASLNWMTGLRGCCKVMLYLTSISIGISINMAENSRSWINEGNKLFWNSNSKFKI